MNDFLFNLTIAIALASVAGCQPVASSATNEPRQPAPSANELPAEEEQFDVPADYASAVERIADDRDAIRSAVASGDLHQAHHPLDEADAVLRQLPEIARASGVPRRYWEQIVVASEDLNELWGEIHAAIDANQTPDYASRQAAIDDAVERLNKVTRESQLTRRETTEDKP